MDLIAEALADGRTAHHNTHPIPDAGFPGQVHHLAHLLHGGGQQSRAGDDVAVMLPGCVNKFLRRHVGPQIIHLDIDAIDAMEGNGPTGGTSHPLHMLLAAKDFYTQDCFAAKLMGLEPTEIVMLRQALEKGLARPKELALVGDPVPEGLSPFQKPDTIKLDFTNGVPKFLRKPFMFVASRLLKSYPQLTPEKCVGCGKCAESCPAHVIRIENRKAKFKRKGCISCFCCQEMCPMKAISVKKAL